MKFIEILNFYGLQQDNEEIENSSVADGNNCCSHSSKYLSDNIDDNQQLYTEQHVEISDINSSNDNENRKVKENYLNSWLHEEYNQESEDNEAWFDVIMFKYDFKKLNSEIYF